jgi:hypothetical protein
MATHRRGLRPSQWPVRDLLGVTADRGRLWDARVGAALAGLLACGAAVTVVVTAGDTAAPDEPAPTTQPPLALPPAVSPPAPPVHKTPPAQAVPPTSGDVGRTPEAAPRPTPPRSSRSADRATGQPRRAPAAAADDAPQPTLGGQITAVIEQAERDPDTVGWLLVPVERPADAAALLELACRSCEPAAGGRHRAYDDVEQRSERHHVGGRHRAPERVDDRPESYRFAHDREEDDGDDADRHRYDGHGGDRSWDDDRRGDDDRHRDDDRSDDREAWQDEPDRAPHSSADDQHPADEDVDGHDQGGDGEDDA